MSGQRGERPKVSTMRKKEEVRKKEETPKNTIATILMKSAKNDDSENDNEGDAHKVSLFIINGCIFPSLVYSLFNLVLYTYYFI